MTEPGHQDPPGQTVPKDAGPGQAHSEQQPGPSPAVKALLHQLPRLLMQCHGHEPKAGQGDPEAGLAKPAHVQDQG